MLSRQERVTGGVLSSLSEVNHETRGGYMNYKVQKLHQSLANSYGPPLSSIFADCAIFVNGLTTPPRNEIQRLVSLHGGAFHSYQTSTTTHFLCDIFPNAKLKQLRKSNQKKLFYVTTSWLLESIEKEKRLPEADYLPKGLIRQHGGSMVQYFSLNSERATDVEQQQEVNVEEIKEECKEQNGEQWIGSEPPLRATSSLPPRPQSEIEEPPLRLSVSLPSKSPATLPIPILLPCPSLLPSAADHRGAASDPNFINNYFETSRLHFLGSWKARLPALRSSIQRERESRKESTQLSLPFPIGKIE
jgi:DNA repair protein REV1